MGNKKNFNIGYLPEERLTLLPKEYIKCHEFCFYIHDVVLQALVEYEKSGVHTIVSNAITKASANKKTEHLNLLELLKTPELSKLYKHHLVSHLVFGLVSDASHFIYESLSSFEKRKFSVGFSLLRKPIKENLLFLAWILGNTDEFIEKFEDTPWKTLNSQKKEKQIEIFNSAISKTPYSEAFNAELLWNMIFSKKEINGLEPAWQKGTHLVTSHGENLQTPQYSLNFIFEDYRDDTNYDLLYKSLPYVMIFFMHVALECFNNLAKMNDQTYSHALICSIGCYEALFLDFRRSSLTRQMNSAFKAFMKCPHCSQAMRITKYNAPALYITDIMICHNCGNHSSFPFYWLLGQSKINLNAQTRSMSIIK